MNIEEDVKKEMVSDEDRVEIIVLVIDNGRDAAKDCITRIMDYVKYPFKLTIYENSLNTLNTSKIWNKLTRESTCGYVCIMDDDSIPYNDFITEMMKVLKKHPEAAAAVPVGDEYSYINDFQKRHGPGDTWIKSDEEEYETYDDASGFCFLFKKSLLDEIGYFDENFYFYGQDSEFTFRVSLSPYVFYIVPKARVNHKHSVASTLKEQEGKFSKQADIEYGQKIMREYKDIDLEGYNPWKKVLKPY